MSPEDVTVYRLPLVIAVDVLTTWGVAEDGIETDLLPLVEEMYDGSKSTVSFGSDCALIPSLR